MSSPTGSTATSPSRHQAVTAQQATGIETWCSSSRSVRSRPADACHPVAPANELHHPTTGPTASRPLLSWCVKVSRSSAPTGGQPSHPGPPRSLLGGTLHMARQADDGDDGATQEVVRRAPRLLAGVAIFAAGVAAGALASELDTSDRASPRIVETSTMRRCHDRSAQEVRPGVP